MAETRERPERYTLIVLAAIALVSFALRIVCLDQKSLWWDESATLNRIQHGLAFVFTNQLKWGENVWKEGHLALYFFLMFLFTKVAGTSDFALRFPSAAWGVLLTVLLFSAGKKLVGRRVGMVAALIGALSPFYIWFSQSARMYTLLPLLGLLSVYLFWNVLEGKPWSWDLAFILTNAALLLTNILGLSIILFEGLTVVIHWLKHRDWRPVVTFSVVTLTAMPVIWFALALSGRSIREEMLPFSLIFKDVLHSYNAGLSLGTPSLQWYDWVFFAIFVLGMLMLTERDKQMRIRRSLFLSGCVLVPFLVLLVPAINLNYIGAHVAVIGSPAFYLLLATGLETMRERSRWAFVLALALMAAVFGVSTYRYFFVPPYTLHRGHDYRSAAQYVNAHAYPNDAIVGSPFSRDAFYRYSDPSLPWYGLPRVTYWDDATFSRETAPELEALKAKHDRIWFIDADYLYVEQNRGVTKNWFSENCVRFALQPFAYVTVHGYLTRSPFLKDWPETGTPLDITFEDALYIKGYELDDPQPQSGEKARITLYMEARRDQDADYGVAIRLRDQRGLVWSERLQPILAGIDPTFQWQAGERVREWRYFEIEPGTPPGAYQAELGVYRVSPYRDLIAYNQDGETIGPSVPLGEVIVQPREHPLPANAVSPQRRLSARFGSEIDLIGLDASLGEIQAGSIVPFVLYYQARSEVESDYVARFLLQDNKGKTVWTKESELVSAAYPTPWWRSGELLRGVHDFFVPPHIPAGHYRVAIQIAGRKGGQYGVHEPRWNPWPRSKLVLFDLDVRAREYSSDLPPISRPLQVSIGEWGELLGYDLDHDTLSGGETLEFTLYWMADRPVTKGYKVFVHVVGQDGHMGAQRDSIPANWSRPTYTWVPGEPIVDTHQVSLPTGMVPGQYDIVIGLYDGKSGERVMLYDQGADPVDHLTLSSLTVQ